MGRGSVGLGGMGWRSEGGKRAGMDVWEFTGRIWLWLCGGAVHIIELVYGVTRDITICFGEFPGDLAMASRGGRIA